MDSIVVFCVFYNILEIRLESLVLVIFVKILLFSIFGWERSPESVKIVRFFLKWVVFCVYGNDPYFYKNWIMVVKTQKIIKKCKKNVKNTKIVKKCKKSVKSVKKCKKG